MKPIRLTMTAFGPYVEKTVVQFDLIKQGIYLITGDTGAGKTTIFDAIVFALFGEASGSNRKPEMLHSDYVSKSQDTQVEFLFSHNGHKYCVERTIHFSKNRAAGAYNAKPTYSATLREKFSPPKDDSSSGEDSPSEEGKPPKKSKTPIEKSEAVTQKIVEIIGLNADQFRKIVMLAQGEFRAFLEADSDKRGEILGKLFDNRIYQLFQNHLRTAEKLLNEKRTDWRNSIRSRLNKDSFYLPDDLDDAQDMLYAPEHPQLIHNLEALVRQDRQEFDEIQSGREEHAKKLDALKAQKSTAELQNKALTALDAAQSRKKLLSSMQMEFAQRKERMERTERALHQVYPAENALNTRRLELEHNAQAQEKLLADINASKAECQRLSKERTQAEQNQGQIDSLKVEIERIDKALPEYDALEQSRKDLQLAQGKAQKAQSTRDAAEQAHVSKQKRIEWLDGELRKLEGAEETVKHLHTQIDAANARTRVLKDMQDNVFAVQKQEQELAEEIVRCREQSNAVNRAEEHFRWINQKFIDGQAAFLAKDLAQRIEAEGSASCPVCNTRLYKKHLPTFASRTEYVPSKLEVDRASKQKKDADEKLSEMRQRCSALEAQVRTGRESVCRQAIALELSEQTWEGISQGDLFRELLGQALAQGRELSDELEQAQKHAQRQAELRKEREETQKRLNLLVSEKEWAEQRLTEQNKEVARLQAALEEKEKHLEYPSKRMAEDRRALCAQRLSAMQEQLERAIRKSDAANEHLHSLEGAKKSLEEQGIRLVGAVKEQEQRFETARRRARFIDMDAYRVALQPIGEEDGEEWIKREQDSINEYERDCHANAELVANLLQETASYRRTDLEELNGQLAKEIQHQEEIEGQIMRARKLLDNHEDTLRVVRNLMDQLHKTDRAYERLSKLSDLALGRNGEGGVWSFDRYAVSVFFQEILGRANDRLSMMSGGKYTLVHQVKGERKNAAAGLNIEVQDAFTGEQRKTASLSGGESFEVSMALALGLSDTVQAHAGGQRMDSMFIDEGFGSLDERMLDKAIEVLRRLAGDTRQIGIISHVAKLEECIQQKIIVEGSNKGSSLKIVI